MRISTLAFALVFLPLVLGHPIAPVKQPEERFVALTFDDGPVPSITSSVLSVLAKYKVPATFFVIGDRVEGNSEMSKLVKQARQQGHGVENHSFSHPSANFQGLCNLGNKEAVIEDLRRAQDVLEECTGTRPKYFRAPQGMQSCSRFVYQDSEQFRALGLRDASSGQYHVAWNHDDRSWDSSTSPASIENTMLNAVNSGGIVLSHDSVSMNLAIGLEHALASLSYDSETGVYKNGHRDIVRFVTIDDYFTKGAADALLRQQQQQQQDYWQSQIKAQQEKQRLQELHQQQLRQQQQQQQPLLQSLQQQLQGTSQHTYDQQHQHQPPPPPPTPHHDMPREQPLEIRKIQLDVLETALKQSAKALAATSPLNTFRVAQQTSSKMIDLGIREIGEAHNASTKLLKDVLAGMHHSFAMTTALSQVAASQSANIELIEAALQQMAAAQAAIMVSTFEKIAAAQDAHSKVVDIALRHMANVRSALL